VNWSFWQICGKSVISLPDTSQQHLSARLKKEKTEEETNKRRKMTWMFY